MTSPFQVTRSATEIERLMDMAKRVVSLAIIASMFAIVVGVWR